ncbi:MAG: hypothetical protein FIA97_11965, partial [Methylococcaceae bacterium]|nr:hypothetical protein [Methylococcaceae bacterium]
YRTADGTAQSGSDYGATHGTLTFDPGQTLQYLFVSVLGDNLKEPDETLNMTLSLPAGAGFEEGAPSITVVGTIVDNEPIIIA